ncbi:MAG: ATP-binding protein, partial [Myxococcota bacterium]
MPLRNRLILAFVALIISSASATIFIGNSVFGNKVDELARNTVSLYTKLCREVLEARVEKMDLLVRRIALRYSAGGNPQKLADVLNEEVPVDFVIFAPMAGDPAVVISDPAGDHKPDPATRDKMGSMIAPLLQRLIPVSWKGTEVISGLVSVPSPMLAFLGLPGSEPEKLILTTVAPISHVAEMDPRHGCSEVQPNCGAIVTGYVLNRRMELLMKGQSLIADKDPDKLMATLFLGDLRIASTKGEQALETRADSKVTDTVLGKGLPFAGIAQVVKDNYYAAYVPLKDLNGEVIGMLGVGTYENVYTEIKLATTIRFASLIAAGMLFGFLMTYLFSLWLVNPISQLAEGVSRVAAGDLNYKVRFESADELGRLALAFNQMVKAVKERDHKLREMTESTLTSVEKQISIGRLAAGVAHEINNPLTAILSLSSLWLKHMSTEDPRREDLEIIVTETSRCRDIVKNLLDFARERPTEKRIVDIRNVIRDTLALTRKYDAMQNTKLDLQLPGFPLNVNGDSKALQQVFTNLLVNAAESMDRGGLVTVTADEDSSGGFVQVVVKDNGKGIPKEHLNRVFEPFFTTKGAHKGTGLGLSVSLGIIRKHDGTIEMDSSP